jgi:hypothetical protein
MGVAIMICANHATVSSQRRSLRGLTGAGGVEQRDGMYFFEFEGVKHAGSASGLEPPRVDSGS